MKNKYKIIETKKVEIKELLQKEKRIIVKERLTAINMYANKLKQEDIACLLGRSRGYVGRAINNYLREGLQGLEEKRGGDRRSELTKEEREELGNIIKKTYPINAKGWDGKIIVNLVEDKYGVKYSVDGIYAILRKLNITYKKARKIDPKKSEEKIKRWKENTKKI